MPSTNKPTLIFFGTPEFSCPALQKLFDNRFKIKAVVTQPDKISPKKKKQVPPIKTLTQKLELPLIQERNIKNNPNFIQQLKSLKADIYVVVAYGAILTNELLKIPPRGVINMHPSLLPKYRGPSPIQSAILNGDTKTGVTIMLIDDKIDHGPILSQKQSEILPKETAKTLNKKLAQLGAELLVETLIKYARNEIIPQEQNHKKATFSKLLKREDGEINWKKSAKEIERMVRAYDPWPGTYTFFGKKRLKILQVEPYDSSKITDSILKSKIEKLKPGQFTTDKKQLILAKTGQGLLKILSLQLEGKSVQTAKQFIHGYHTRLK